MSNIRKMVDDLKRLPGMKASVPKINVRVMDL